MGAFGLAACVAGPAANAASAPTPLPPAITVVAPAPTLGAPTPTPAPAGAAPVLATVPYEAPDLDLCTAAVGTVVSVTVPSTTLRYPIDTRVYLPPCYAATTQRYPVLYLMHGLGFTEDQWQRLGVITATHELLAAGEIAPLIIVMPRDRRDDRLDPALVKDLIPYIDGAYRTLDAPAARAIGGLSRGGGWAVHFGLRYPELFGRIGLHSPAVFYDDEINILEWSRQLRDRPKPAVYIDTGEGDATIRSPVWLDQVFTWFDFGHTFIIQPGGHSERYWSQHVADYLRFYAADWRTLKLPVSDETP